RVGLKPLLNTGALVIAAIIATEITHNRSLRRPDDQRNVALEVEKRVDKLVRRLAANKQLIAADPKKDANTKKFLDEVRADINDTAAMISLSEAAPASGPIWPVVLAGAAFLYLWWLAALTFDLSFVWHLYIRYDGARNYVRDRLAIATDACDQAAQAL